MRLGSRDPERALAIRVATAGSAYFRVASARRRLAGILMALDRPAEAEAELLAAWRGLAESGETSMPQARAVAEMMADLQATLGAPERAAAWRERAGGR